MEKEIINYRGIDIEIAQDEYCESPDSWGNTDIFLVYDHRQFYVERKGFDPQDIAEWYNAPLKSLDYESLDYDGYWVFPVAAYIHSGVSLSLTSKLGRQGWDTSVSGFILVSVKDWKDEIEAKKAAESLIETWNEYLSGDVWGYNSEYGSCWGFYGDSGKEQMIEEAKSEIDYALKKLEQKRQEKLKVYIKNHVPLSNRIYA